MRCLSCNSELPPNAKFCLECGTAQIKKDAGLIAAPNAEAAVRRVADYTPKHLADKILRSKSALEGERKQVTVLFADVKGSLELAEQLDPEVWHGILERFFQILTDGVHRFEGTVNQYTGDGIMALFGAPIAHEDHAQRACYAALHLRDRLREYADKLRTDPGLSFAFRLGLNSGEVVVGKIGDDLRMDYTAQGLTVGLAQRMEQLAPADGIALSQHTQKSIGGFFALRALGPVAIKGARDPVGVFILEGQGAHRTRLDTSRARGLSRFVGRRDEIDALESSLQHALAGTGRVGAVVGEAGVGKSRLCAEFLARCRARGYAVFAAHCPAHGRAIPYLPLLELLRNLFGIVEQDGPQEARQKIAGALALLDDSFADDRALVLDFLGVADPKAPPLPLEPAVRQRLLFAFVRRLLQRRTETDLIVILIDDLHWIDPASDLFVTQIVEAVHATRTFLLVNFRPEYHAEWTRKSWVLQLPMAPLNAEALAELVRDWVGNHASVAGLPALVGTRSGGNPFFAEEIILSLLETDGLSGSRGAYQLTTPLSAVTVPATVQVLLAARIDRLGDDQKQLLYTAAVIGKEFQRPLLESALDVGTLDIDAALAGLLAAELIFERAIYPIAEYAFKHPLTHEVALGAQLTSSRRARHARVAAAIASAEAARLDEFAGLLAHHWTEAGELLRAAEWHVRAARWVRLTDLLASKQHWTAGRDLLRELSDSPARTRLLLDIYPELINSLDQLGAAPSESASVYQEAVALAQQVGDQRVESFIEAAYGWLKTGYNDWPASVEHNQRAMILADAARDRPLQLFSRMSLGRAALWQGRLHDAINILDEAIAIAGGQAAANIEVLGLRPFVISLSLRALTHSYLGQPRIGAEFAEYLLGLLRQPSQRADMSTSASDCTLTAWILGDPDRAARYSGEALREAERFGSDHTTVYALLVGGIASCVGLRWTEGNRFFARTRERIDSSGVGREWTMFIHGFEALCCAGLGDRERSLALARSGVAQARGNALDLARILQGTLQARVLRMVGGPEHQDELAAAIAETLALIERTDMQGYLPLLLLERAGLARMRGDSDAMARDLTEARRLFAAMDVTGWDDYARSIEA